MSEATLPRAHQSERRLGATVWFVWMVALFGDRSVASVVNAALRGQRQAAVDR
jgi:hypothetical protein